MIEKCRRPDRKIRIFHRRIHDLHHEGTIYGVNKKKSASAPSLHKFEFIAYNERLGSFWVIRRCCAASSTTAPPPPFSATKLILSPPTTNYRGAHQQRNKRVTLEVTYCSSKGLIWIANDQWRMGIERSMARCRLCIVTCGSATYQK